MMLTALECRVSRPSLISPTPRPYPFSQTAGVTFAAVHDSYWTHASTIDHMSRSIRDTFIELHSSDVLQRLDAEVNLLNFRGTLAYSSLD